MRILRFVSVSFIAGTTVFLAHISPVSGRPYRGEEQVFTQPDGTSLPLLLHGDEFFIRAETMDGYTVVRDAKTKWFCYARLSDAGNALVSSGIPAVPVNSRPDVGRLGKGLRLPGHALKNRIETSRVGLFGGRTPDYAARMDALAKSAPAAADTLPSRKNPANFTGVCRGLCVVWDFSDAPITAIYPSADSAIRFLDKKFNSIDPKDNSLRYYFQVWSGGKFDVQFMVKGVYRAPNTFAYYDGLSYGRGHSELIISACKTLDAEGFDFSQLTRKSTGSYVRGLCIANTGKPATWAEGMWNHSGTLSGSFSADGVSLRSYCTCAAAGGALAHEMGHLIAEWPDLYSSNDVATGCWDIMGSSGSSLANPYLLYLNGWNDVVNIGNLPAGTLVTASGRYPNIGHLYYRNVKPDEFFYFKPYTKQMPLCSSAPDQGLTIWHINKKGNNFDYPTTPLLVEMVHANNTISNIRTNVCFKAGGSSAYSSATTPAAKWVDNSPSGIDIMAISAADTVMTFRLGGTVENLPREAFAERDKPVISLAYRNGGPVLVISKTSPTPFARLVLCTVAGKSVLERELLPGGAGPDVSFLPAGLYVAHLRGAGKSVTEKIVIGQ